MSVDVSVAVQVRGCDACLDHAINLRRALLCDLRGIDAPNTGASNEEGQGIELAGFAPRQRRGRGKRHPRREIEMETDRERTTRSRPPNGIVEPRQVHYHRSGGDHARARRFYYSNIDAARESVVVGVDDEPSGTTRRSHAHRFGGRGSGPSASPLHAWRRRLCSAHRRNETPPASARS